METREEQDRDFKVVEIVGQTKFTLVEDLVFRRPVATISSSDLVRGQRYDLMVDIEGTGMKIIKRRLDGNIIDNEVSNYKNEIIYPDLKIYVSRHKLRNYLIWDNWRHHGK